MVREDFIGLSTDTKRTDVANGSTFYCADNSKAYVFLNGTWYEKTADEPTPPAPSDDWGTVTYLDADNQPVTATLQSLSEVESMCNITTTPSHKAIIAGVEVAFDKITKVNLGSSVTGVDDNFLISATSLVEITAPKLESAGQQFLYGASSLYDKDIDFPELEYLGGYSFQGNWTGEFKLPKLKVCGYGFLQSANPSNDVLSFPELVETGTRFLYGASSFNAPISMPKLKILGQDFLRNASSFNSSLDIPVVEEIGNYFMDGCSAFDQKLTLPSTLQRFYNGGTVPYICRNCNSFTSELTMNCPPTIISSNPSASNTAYMFVGSSNSAAIKTTGFTLVGEYASAWKNIMPDSGFNRKINNR